MAVGTKRKRATPNGLLAGELLKRDKLAGPEAHSQWGWTASITESSQITVENRHAVYGFHDRIGKPICKNKHGKSGQRGYKKPKVNMAHANTAERTGGQNLVEGEDEHDIIVISSSDEEPNICTKKRCRDNPQCINYVGQATLEKDDALQFFFEVANIGPSPLDRARNPDIPVGLKNLGATCYANAFIQVWFQDRAFRDGVYRCQLSQEEGISLEDSPIFQLQITFAALQASTQNVFNPVKLVESLQIRAAEQQDAQEFSKLFMSHLASEFEKQAVPSLKTLISNQFEGKQTYGTLCRKCGSRSEQETNFLELEINLENNGKLEDCIRALLRSEELGGDNRYHCTRCDGLQEATRYTKLKKLPPVLHISVLRFVFDLSSLSRKKSKHCILFPLVLDMSAFMDNEEATSSGPKVPAKRVHEECGDEHNSEGLLYELRGVLLHKGSSAYHGHYEAQVFDSATKQFYQFNDEIVTHLSSLKSKKLPSRDKDINDSAMSAAANKRRRTYSRKKVRVEDSDGESDKRLGVNKEDEHYIFSNDAYMLIYARHDGLSEDTAQCQVPQPPVSAQVVVAKLNDEYSKACILYQERQKALTEVFNRMRQSKKSIYSCWEIRDMREESAVVSRSALEAWVLKDIEISKNTGGATVDDGQAHSSDHSKENSPLSGERHSLSRSSSPFNPREFSARSPVPDSHRFDNSGIVCRHNGLDPRKTNDMKRIRNESVIAIRHETGCLFEPQLTTMDICEHCVRELFIEKRYNLDHPEHVSQLDEICAVGGDGPGAWISKRWLADWRQTKPKMHIPGKDDPPPDAPEYVAHVRCVHDRLSLISASRKRISEEACAFLQGLFPTWRSLSDNSQPCQTCNEERLLLKENKQELKKQIDDEKSQLRTLLSSSILSMDAEIIPGVTQAIVPTDFLRQWRAWLLRPHETHRPGPIDNAWLLCEHDRLVIDPNISEDLGPSISLVSLSDWDTLIKLYGGGPLIGLTGPAQEIGSSVVHDYDICHTCRKERLRNFENATITIRVLDDDAPDPTTDCHEGRKQDDASPGRTRKIEQEAVKNESERGRPLRKSNRLRKSRRTVGRKLVRVNKFSTVKDIKIELQDDLDTPTICQRLFFKGVELVDNTERIVSLGITANDTLYLRKEKENDDALNSDPDHSTRGDEGRAFGGTILSGLSKKTSATDEETDPLSCTEYPCPACTFVNPEGLSTCSICDSQLRLC